jgi:hypothetical protein
MKRMFALLVVTAISTLFVACGNKGGRSTGPTSNTWIQAIPASVQAGQTTTLSWSSLATSCVASGDWDGALPGTSQRTVGPLVNLKTYSFSIVCGTETATATVVVTSAGGDNNSFVSSDGLVTVSVVDIVPGRDQRVIAGGSEYIKLSVQNNSDQPLRIYDSVVDNELDSPGQPGRDSGLLSIVKTIPAHSGQTTIFGLLTVSAPEGVPWLRLTGAYGEGASNWAWGNITIRLGWTK